MQTRAQLKFRLSLAKRHWIRTSLELLSPLCLGLIIVIVVLTGNRPQSYDGSSDAIPPQLGGMSSERIFGNLTECLSYCETYQKKSLNCTLAFVAPEGSQTMQFAKGVEEAISAGNSSVMVVRFNTRSELDNWAADKVYASFQSNFNIVVFGIVESDARITLISGGGQGFLGSPGTAASGVVFEDLALLFLRTLTNGMELLTPVGMGGFAEGPEQSRTYFQISWPFLNSFLTILACIQIASVAAHEREAKLKSSMDLAGTSELSYLVSLATPTIVLTLAGVLIYQVIFFALGCTASVGPGVFIGIFLLYVPASVLHALLISNLISGPKGALLLNVLHLLFGLAMSAVMWFLGIGSLHFGATALLLFLSILSPIVPCALAFFVVSNADSVNQSAIYVFAGYFPVALSFAMLFIDIVLYCALCLYVQWLRSGGRQRQAVRKAKGSYVPLSDSGNADGDAAISLEGISKHYGNSAELAVNNLSFVVRPGRITSLLGENGAGKTTLISILSGLISESSGTAQIFGMNVAAALAQRVVGVCRQQDHLWPDATVLEHALLFFRLGGQEDAAAVDLLTRFSLDDAQQTLSSNLSGGMKRKLSLLIALAGNPRLLILDEPSSGLDPFSAQQLWKILRELDQTVLLSTHSMLEAETLSADIKIMRAGELVAEGSFAELEERYQLGYTVSFSRNDEAEQIVENVTRSNVSKTLTNEMAIYNLGLDNDLLYAVVEALGDLVKVSLKASSLAECFYRAQDE